MIAVLLNERKIALKQRSGWFDKQTTSSTVSINHEKDGEKKMFEKNIKKIRKSQPSS